MKKISKGAGGKMLRSEIIQARLSPKLKFALDIMAQKQRRTASSLIECLLEEACKNFKIVTGKTGMRSTYIQVSIKSGITMSPSDLFVLLWHFRSC